MNVASARESQVSEKGISRERISIFLSFVHIVSVERQEAAWQQTKSKFLRELTPETEPGLKTMVESYSKSSAIIPNLAERFKAGFDVSNGFNYPISQEDLTTVLQKLLESFKPEERVSIFNLVSSINPNGIHMGVPIAAIMPDAPVIKLALTNAWVRINPLNSAGDNILREAALKRARLRNGLSQLAIL